MREEVFRPIKDRYIGYFEDEARKVEEDFDYVSCTASAFFPSNENPPGVGYFSMFIDCLLKDAALDKVDNLGIGIEAFDKNDVLTIRVDLCWGYPSEEIDIEIFEEPVPATEANLNLIQTKLPFLVSKLRELIRDNPNGV